MNREVALLVAGGALQAAGVLMVLGELWAGRRRAREWLAKGSPESGAGSSWDQLESVGPMLREVLAREGPWAPLGAVLLVAGLTAQTVAGVLSAT